MPRIAAGEDFGRTQVQGGGVQAPQPLDLRGVAGAGKALEREGLQAQNAQEQQLLADQAEIRQQAKEQAHARDMADRARATSVLALGRDGIADTLQQVGNELSDGRLPKTEAVKAWRERTAELVQKHIADVPETQREIVRADLQGLVQRFDSRVGEAVRLRDQHDTRADLGATLESLQRSASVDYGKARASAIAALDTLGPAAGMPADQIQKAKQTWLEGAAYTRAFTAVNMAKNDNAALSAAAKAISGNADLDPQKQAALLNQVENYKANNEARALREAQRAEIVAQRRDREAQQAYSVLSGWALAGKAANPEAAAGLISKLSGTPYAAAYKELAAEIPARAVAAMLPLDQQQAQLDALIAQRTAKGTSEALETEIKRREQVLSDARKDYKEDPLRAAAQRGILDAVAPLDMSSMDGIARSLVGRVDQAQMVATRTRSAVSPFLPEEAARFGDMLAGLPVADRGRGIAALSGLMPPGMMQAIARQVDGRNRALSLEIALGASKTTSGQYASTWVARGAQAIKDKAVKEDSEAMTGLRAQLAQQIGDALPGRAREDVIDAARFMFMGQQAAGLSPSIPGVIGLALGGSLIEHNGKRVPVPAGMDESSLRQKLRTYPHKALQKQVPDAVVYMPGGRPMGVPEFLAGLPDAQLEAVGTGRYMVRAGTGLAMDSNRNPIVIEVQP